MNRDHLSDILNISDQYIGQIKTLIISSNDCSSDILNISDFINIFIALASFEQRHKEK